MNKNELYEYRIKKKIKDLKELYEMYMYYVLKDDEDEFVSEKIMEIKKQIFLLEDILNGV